MEDIIAAGRWTLEEASRAPLLPEEAVLEWGKVLVVAPHPDDESLGCGGVVHLLRRAGRPVKLFMLTDGSASHPGSQEYPPERLRELRRHETLTAANALGVPSQDVHFANLVDAQVPPVDSPAAQSTIQALRRELQEVHTVLVTWRLDPHSDHRAAAEYVQAAAAGLPLRLLEYPVWLWFGGKPEDFPSHDQFAFQRLDITTALSAKAKAVAAHASQTGGLIHDAADGFTVPDELRAHFAQPWELFLVPKA